MARQTAAQLLVVGAAPHWRTGQGRLGTTARRLLRRAAQPVLVVRVPHSPPHRVLLATDLSPESGTVMDLGLDLLESLGVGAKPVARALLVMAEGIVPPPLPADTLTRAAEHEMAQFMAGRAARTYPVSSALRTGEAAPQILSEAAAWGADMVVLGTHGRRGAERILLGSVAESSLVHLSCNALVVPPARVAAARRPEAPLRSPAVGAA